MKQNTTKLELYWPRYSPLRKVGGAKTRLVRTNLGNIFFLAQQRKACTAYIDFLYYVIECVSPWVVQSSDCVRNIYRLYFGVSDLYDFKPDETLPRRRYPRPISISPDPCSSDLVNDRLLIDWNVPATLLSFHVETTVCDYSKIICLQCSRYFAPVTRHSVQTMCTMFSRKDFLRIFDGLLRISFHQKNQRWI